MPKHFVSFEAQCPFYQEEEKNIIYCEGLTDHSRIHNAFDTDARWYKKKYCCCEWNKCMITDMLMKKYE